MIEVNLFEIPAGSSALMGKCIDRTRFNKETLGTSVMEFVKGFLKTNVQNFESALGNPDLISFINGDDPMTTSDFSAINYWLKRSGFYCTIWNVTDDEENALGVTGETSEWNIIDNNFLQNDYPTVVKNIPEMGTEIITVLKKVIEGAGLFKIPGVKNPLEETMEKIDRIKEVTGRVDPALIGKIYEDLGELGISIFLAVSE